MSSRPPADRALGLFQQVAEAVVEIDSGDFVTIETLTHHANDDSERMIEGRSGRRERLSTGPRTARTSTGAAPGRWSSILGRGAGEGFGVHICTGPVYVRGAEPGDVLEVRILDVKPRPCANPEYRGKAFGSNAAAWWGFHYNDLLTEPKPREVITIYEIDADRRPQLGARRLQLSLGAADRSVRRRARDHRLSRACRSITHSFEENHGILKDVRVPIRPHFGSSRVAPTEADIVDSIPPGYSGGNIDNWRIGKGATMYYPVAVAGALLLGRRSACLTGRFRALRHGDRMLADRHVPADPAQAGQRSPAPRLADLNYPLLETQDEWVVHGFSYANYLAELGENAQSEIFEKSSVDLAMRDAFRKMRHFLMTTRGLSEDEAISLISVAVDFGVTQVVDGNWGVHAIMKNHLCRRGGLSVAASGARGRPKSSTAVELEAWRRHLDVDICVTVDHAAAEWRGNAVALIPRTPGRSRTPRLS